jgi:hypothetical protein
MPRWEYRTIELNEFRPGDDDINALNDAGKEGWELVGIAAHNIAYMKRQVTSLASPQQKAPSDNGGFETD